MTRNIAVFVGSRADGEPLGPVINALGECVRVFDYSRFGSSCYALRHAVHRTSKAMLFMTEKLETYKPALLLILGDRHEALGAATAAHLMGVPIMHLSGGDVTLGSRDDAIRNAITKLASLHAATCSASAARIEAMGEEAWRIKVTGCPGVDRVMRTGRLNRDETLRWIGYRPGTDYLLVLFQSATAVDYLAEGEQLTKALRAEPPGRGIVVGSFGPDPGGIELWGLFSKALGDRPGFVQLEHVAAGTFFSLIEHASVVVGNSSSILYEVPSLRRPAVLVGERQRGRGPVASCISECPADWDKINITMHQVERWNCSSTINPFGDGFAGERIAAWVRSVVDHSIKNLLIKEPAHAS